MPKSAKKRRDKAADFSKAKLKLGKGKQLASNAVDTSFKARSIALPSQSIVSEKDATAPVTKRRLTFDDLMSKLKHYSPGVRRDALLGLQELLGSHWEMLESCLTVLINAVVRILSDEDSSVRKACLSFLSWLLPKIPSEDLTAHAPVLLLFATSAQTHIFPEIRIDAIRFLNLLLSSIPDFVIQGWNEQKGGHGSRVLEGYLGLLNAGTKYGEHEGPLQATSTASVVLTPTSKLVVLQSLSMFLQATVRADPSISRTTKLTNTSCLEPWFMKPAFINSSGYNHFCGLLECSEDAAQRVWHADTENDLDSDVFWYRYPLISPESQALRLEDFDNLSSWSDLNEVEEANSSKFHFVSHLARTLHPTLVGTFLDCAPTVFGPTSKSSHTEAQLILSVSQVARSLYGMMSQFSRNSPDLYTEDLHVLISYMAPYFPFRLDGNRDVKIEQVLESLNLIYCELTSLIIAGENEMNQATRQGLRRHRPRAFDPTGHGALQETSVSMFITKLLRGDDATSSQVAQPVGFTTYAELLPPTWAFINNSATVELGVLDAVLEHALKVPAKSNLKRATVEFVGRLVLLGTEAQYQGSFRLGQDVTIDQKAEAWFLHLPQALWEIGASNLCFTEVILRILLRSIQSRCTVARPEVLLGLRSRLVPYFKMIHATRGELLGPYSKLPASSRSRRLALDVAATVCADTCTSSDETDALAVAANAAVAGTPEEQYWFDVKKSLSIP